MFGCLSAAGVEIYEEKVCLWHGAVSCVWFFFVSVPAAASTLQRHHPA